MQTTPNEIFKTDEVEGPIPTSDWWSSLAWTKHSAPMFAHPLVLRAIPQGLSVTYPGPSIVASERAIVGGAADGDLILSVATNNPFSEARFGEYSDWFVQAVFQTQPECSEQALAMAAHSSMSSMKAFDRKLLLPSGRVVAECKRSVSRNFRSRPTYGLFGPAGSTWSQMKRGMSTGF